jgi:hypothetical protein
VSTLEPARATCQTKRLADPLTGIREAHGANHNRVTWLTAAVMFILAGVARPHVCNRVSSQQVVEIRPLNPRFIDAAYFEFEVDRSSLTMGNDDVTLRIGSESRKFRSNLVWRAWLDTVEDEAPIFIGDYLTRHNIDASQR